MGCLMVQVLAVFGLKLPSIVSVPVYTTLVFILELLPFQTKDVPWKTWGKPAGLHYLWIVKKHQEEEEDAKKDDGEAEKENKDDFDGIHEFQHLGEKVVDMKRGITA